MGLASPGMLGTVFRLAEGVAAFMAGLSDAEQVAIASIFKIVTYELLFKVNYSTKSHKRLIP
jgi:hypothetical protein